MLALAQGEAEIRGDDVMNALAGEEAKLPTANVAAAAARRRRDGMVAVGSTVRGFTLELYRRTILRKRTRQTGKKCGRLAQIAKNEDGFFKSLKSHVRTSRLD